MFTMKSNLILNTVIAASAAITGFNLQAQDYFQRICMEGVELRGAITHGMVDPFTVMDAGVYIFDYNKNFEIEKNNPVKYTYIGGGCVYHDGKVYANEYDGSNRTQEVKPIWKVYDAKTFSVISQTELNDNCENTTTSLAYDPTSDKIYGFVKDYTDTYLVEVDPETGSMTKIKQLDKLCKYNAIACNKNGKLYCVYHDVMTETGYFARINKTDGKIAIVGTIKMENLMPGDLYINSQYKQAMFFNNETDKLYWMFQSSSLALGSEYTAIAEMNTMNGVGTLVGYLKDPYHISGAYFQEPSLSAPGIVTDFSYNPEKVGALNGTLSFTIPANSYDGKPMSGDVRVVVKEGKYEIINTTATPGSEFVSEQLFFSNELHHVSITVSNDAGDGPTIERQFYSGYDVPRACQNIHLVSNGLTTTLTWDPPVEGMNGGIINTENYTYKVVRYPYEVVVAEAQTERVFTETHPGDMTRYVYAVIPMDGTREGQSAFSNNLIVGTPLNPPYGGEFRDAADMMNYYTILDANNDRCTWSYDINTGSAFYDYSYYNDADDWLISPPINYKKGTEYVLSFKAYSYNPDYLERMDVTFGKERTPQSQNENRLLHIEEVPSVFEDHVQEYRLPITVDEDGVYYYGFHVTTPAFYEYLFLLDIKLEYADGSSVEKLVEDTKLTIGTEAGRLFISNPESQNVKVYDTGGRLISENYNTEIVLNLASGIYVITNGIETRKAVVL